MLTLAACGSRVETGKNIEAPVASLPPAAGPTELPVSTPAVPNLQSELLDQRFRTTDSAISRFDFRNFTYELPRGWQNPDGTTDITLKKGRVSRVETKVDEKMDNDAKAGLKSQRRIGMSFVTEKFMDVTGDGEDEAIVILKVETGGAAIPQLVYVFSWKDNRPELIWPFRTGDRADGGLKDIRVENGQMVVELYGQDRFLLGQTETGKIGDDVEQLCCPTHFTRSFYKWNGKNFLMQGKRLTYSVADPSASPVQNMGEVTQKKDAKR